MLYTRKGDSGTTKTFGCDQRISKSSVIAEALGTLDECNSFLGLVKVKSKNAEFWVAGKSFERIVHDLQNNLFTVQAELAGAEKTIEEHKVKEAERIIDTAEQILPPIKSFFISGGCELAAIFDFARTLSRRAERRVVGVHESQIQPIGEHSLAYLNRISSLLYALARLCNHKSGQVENSPSYK